MKSDKQADFKLIEIHLPCCLSARIKGVRPNPTPPPNPAPTHLLMPRWNFKSLNLREDREVSWSESLKATSSSLLSNELETISTKKSGYVA